MTSRNDIVILIGRAMLTRLIRVEKTGQSMCETRIDEESRSYFWRKTFFAAAMFLFVILLVVWQQGFLLPHATWLGNPGLVTRTPAELGLRYNPVEIEAIDGTSLIGWYIPQPDLFDEEKRWRQLNDYFLQGKEPPQKESNSVLLLGDGEHSRDKYLKTAQALNRLGYSVFLFDYRGCGDSLGETSPDSALEDARVLIRFLLNRRPPEKIAVYGTGLGANIATEICRLVEEEQPGRIRALVLEEPVISLEDYHQRNLIDRYGNFLASWIEPYRPLDTEIRPIEENLASLSSLPSLFILNDQGQSLAEETLEPFVNHQEPKDLWIVSDSRTGGEAAERFPLEASAQLGRFLDPFVAGQGYWSPKITTSYDPTNQAILIEAKPVLFPKKEQSPAVPVEVYFFTGKDLIKKRIRLNYSPSPVQLSLPAGIAPTFHFGKLLHFVEPSDQPEKRPFLLSRAGSLDQYGNRIQWLKKEKERLTRLSSALDKKLSGAPPAYQEKLRAARQLLENEEITPARSLLKDCLDRLQPQAEFKPDKPGTGLIWLGRNCPPDGAGEKGSRQGRAALHTRIDQGGRRLYFKSSEFLPLAPDNTLTAIVVEYFDEGEDLFGLRYDSWDAYATAFEGDEKRSRMVLKSGAGQWDSTLFVLDDARFEGRGPGQSDFSITAIDERAAPNGEWIGRIRLYIFEQ
jgi:pimeloyl-ACP methyl ester carboxylesterase